MVTEELIGCRYTADDPSVFGIDLDRVSAAGEQLNARSKLLADAVQVGPELMPGIHNALHVSAKRLGVKSVIHGYVYNDPAVQAACVHVGGDARSAIMLSSGLIRLLSTDELSFVIGHELGHMLFEHNLYPRPMDASDEGTRLNWLALQRAGEISADRIGLLACGSSDIAFRTILKTGTGLGDDYLRFDLATFLDQLRHLKRIGGHASGIISSHPILTVRMKALLWFEMSDVARRLDGTKTHGASLLTVDRRVEGLLEEATGEILSRVRAESFQKAAMWALLFAAVSDGLFSKQEQWGIESLYGHRAVENALTFVRENGPEQVGVQFEDAMKEVRFHPESGRREFRSRLRDDFEKVRLDEAQRVRILAVVEDRLGLGSRLRD